MIEYQEITDADIPKVVELYTQYLNSGAGIRAGIYAAWKQGAYFGCKAVSNGNIAAICTIRHGLEFTYPHPDLETEVRLTAGAQDIYTVDAMVVLPEYRCHGIAHQLVADTVRQFRARASGVIMTEIWIYPNGECPAKEPYETMGRVFFQKKIPMFYRDLARYSLTCPICGEHCVCGAWVELVDVWSKKL